ncbi:MAG: 7-cyano-7-deazaguanine synthase QueC [Proteobacteria bacterium]|nr:MAG: 7-cyano-7-deazaguanine synthase QueC [Pseudomonadota bacterium]
MKAMIICSGGLDSVTLAYKVAAENSLTSLVSFQYGQRHDKELSYAARCAQHFAVPHHIIDISNVGAQLTGSALTDDVDVPDGHYAEDSMKLTIVPNRNAIMLTIAYGMAASQGADTVGIAVHGGDHFIYPDCRPEFIEQFAKMQKMALDGFADIDIYAPFLQSSKADITAAGAALNVPFADTWSCYKGGEKHCGKCGTCVERAEAFYNAGVTDPTDYEDPDFWRSAVQSHHSEEAAHVSDQ